MTDFIISLVGKVTIIVGLGLVLTAMMRRTSPAYRHVILLGTLMSVLLLPVLVAVAPAWNVPVLEPAATPTPSIAVVESKHPLEPATSVPGPLAEGIEAKPASSLSRRWTSIDFGGPTLALVIWFLGAMAVLAWLALGHLRLRSLAEKSWPLDGADWTRALREESARADVDAPVLLICHPDVSTPLTWGSLDPVIMLPEDALEWPEEHRRIVLRHELSHVERNDALAQLAAGIACAIYWFHPLVWIAERRLRAECERACDNKVVASGTPAPIYAAHLLEVARSARSFGGPGFLSVAMARPSQLEGRLLALLDESPRHGSVGRRARWLMLASMAGVTLIVSAFRPVYRATAAGEITEPTVSEADDPPVVAPLTIHEPSQANVPQTDIESRTAAITASSAVRLDSTFEHTVAVRSGGTLSLEINRTGGTVSVTGWDRPQVRVRARLGGRNWRDTRVTLEPVNGGAVLRDTYVGSSTTSSFSNSYEINVPVNFNVRVASAGGGVSIKGVRGSFTGVTGGGPIVFDRATGEADLRTGGGDVTINNSSLEGSVKTGGGEVRIDGSGTGLVARSRGGTAAVSSNANGGRASVIATDILRGGSTTTYMSDDRDTLARFGTGGIERHRSGGDITLRDAPAGARVTTGGGAIRIGSSSGEVYAKTGGGTIEIGSVAGSVVASTGAGDITVTFRGADRNAADLTTGRGDVTLILPANTNAQLVLESAYTNNLGRKTHIESDWPLRITETDQWDSSVGTPRKYLRARHILGTGGRVIRVRAINGNVVIRRTGGN